MKFLLKTNKLRLSISEQKSAIHCFKAKLLYLLVVICIKLTLRNLLRSLVGIRISSSWRLGWSNLLVEDWIHFIMIWSLEIILLRFLEGLLHSGRIGNVETVIYEITMRIEWGWRWRGLRWWWAKHLFDAKSLQGNVAVVFTATPAINDILLSISVEYIISILLPIIYCYQWYIIVNINRIYH